MSVPFSALIDASTFAVLALSPFPYVVSFLVRSQPLAAEQAHAVNWPNYRQNFTLAGADGVLPRWTWNREARLFSPTPEQMITPELKQRSLLAAAKCNALADIIYELSVARFQVHRGVLLQEVVYAAKQAQAQRFRDDGYPDAFNICNYPYVVQYADFAGLTPREAADEILFKAKLDQDLLLKSEGMRLKYFNLLRGAIGIEEVAPLLQNFREEVYRSRPP